MDTENKPLHLRSVVKRDDAGNIKSISVVRSETPQFATPAFDEVMRKGIPKHLWRRRD